MTAAPGRPGGTGGQRPTVVATDLDGTLLRSDGTVSPRTRAALAAAEQSGALVVFVTGRPPRWLPPVAEVTGHRGLAVCGNGAYVYDLHQDRVVEQHLIEPAAAATAARVLREAMPGVAFAVERGEQLAHEPGYRPRWATEGAVVDELDNLLTEPVGKLLARLDGTDSDTLLARAREVAGELLVFTCSSRDGLLEASAAGISKASTLDTLCREHGRRPAQAVAFGDMPNDLPMLAWAGHSVAVAGAHPDVLAAVHEVTAGNDDDGVAAVLERLFG